MFVLGGKAAQVGFHVPLMRQERRVTSPARLKTPSVIGEHPVQAAGAVAPRHAQFSQVAGVEYAGARTDDVILLPRQAIMIYDLPVMIAYKRGAPCRSKMMQGRGVSHLVATNDSAWDSRPPTGKFQSRVASRQ
jgi:hypothetical protein